MTTKRIGVRAKRKIDFDEALYRALRDYQDRKMITNGTAVGNLSQDLTAVYDRVRDAASKLVSVRRLT